MNTETQNQEEQVEQPAQEIIEPLTVSEIVPIFIEEARKLGQIIMPSLEVNDSLVSIIRLCNKDGVQTKQFFEISIKEVDVLHVRK
jgi:hypothetical protein